MLINILKVLIQKYGKEYEKEFDISNKLNPEIEFLKWKVQNFFCIKCRLF